MKQRGHRRKVMLIVPYCRTLALSFHGCVHHSTAGLQTSTCRSSMQHMYPWCAVCGQLHLKLHRGLLLWEACCVLTPHKNLDLRPPLFTCWFEHGQIFFFFFSLPLFCCLAPLDPPRWSVLKQYTTLVLVGCSLWWERKMQQERITSFYYHLLWRNQRMYKWTATLFFSPH